MPGKLYRGGKTAGEKQEQASKSPSRRFLSRAVTQGPFLPWGSRRMHLSLSLLSEYGSGARTATLTPLPSPALTRPLAAQQGGGAC